MKHSSPFTWTSAPQVVQKNWFLESKPQTSPFFEGFSGPGSSTRRLRVIDCKWPVWHSKSMPWHPCCQDPPGWGKIWKDTLVGGRSNMETNQLLRLRGGGFFVIFCFHPDPWGNDPMTNNCWSQQKRVGIDEADGWGWLVVLIMEFFPDLACATWSFRLPAGFLKTWRSSRNTPWPALWKTSQVLLKHWPWQNRIRHRTWEENTVKTRFLSAVGPCEVSSFKAKGAEENDAYLEAHVEMMRVCRS